MLRKGFTLIELLIVIGILAILATAVVLVLNPAQILAETRDSQRFNDLKALNSALNLYLTTVSSPDLDGSGSCSSSCFVNINADPGGNQGCDGRHGSKSDAVDADRTVDGTGWLPVDLTDTQGGSPLSVLPVDPINNTAAGNCDVDGGGAVGCYYSYACDGTNRTFELNAALESVRYATTENKDGSDGGDTADVYEIGTDPGLNL